MRTKVLCSLIVFSLFFSCKNDKSSATEEKAVKQNFSVEFDVVAEKPDDFTVYYTETNTNEFSGDKAIWSGVKGNNVDEKVIIDLPEEIIPTNIRLDFGVKPDRKDVLLKNLKFTFYGNSFEVKGSDFFNYFVVREGVKTEINAANSTIKFIKTPTQTEGTNFYPRQELLDKIASITKETK